MIIYEVRVQLDSGWNLERQILEYNVYEDNKTSFTMSRQGSIGTYVLQATALDSQYHWGSNGIHFYTKDKSKIKEYCKLCDDHIEKYLQSKVKLLNKHLGKIGTPWGDEKPKAKKEEKQSDDDI